MPIQTFSRFEKKYMVSKEQYQSLINMIKDKLEYDPYSKDGAYYEIYNIYFDTEKNSLISESVKKPVYKEKVRLRSYKGNCNDNDLVFLEIKKKSEGKVNKRRIVIKYSEAKDYINDNVAPKFKEDDYLNNQVLKEIEYINHRYNLVPNYFISYHRVAYFAKEDPSIRITFDDKILERKDDVNFNNVEGIDILPKDTYLMEIKVGSSFPLWLASALSELQIYPRSFSKYGAAYKFNTLKMEELKCIV